MNERYLYRGKTKPDGEWIYGGHMYVESLDRHIIVEHDGCKQFSDECFGFSAVIPETVGQCTGLKDKNGKLIFEGDVLKQKTTPEFAKVNSFKWELYGIVRFGNYDWNAGKIGYESVGYYIEPLKDVAINPPNYNVGHIQSGLSQCDVINKYYPMEIIGNIHDNTPDLLEVEK